MLSQRAVVSFIAGFCVLLIWEYTVGNADARSELPAVEQEFERIRSDDSGIRVSAHAASKPESVSVGAKYSSDLSCAAVYSHYDAELARNGWRFAKGHTFTGGSTREYRKGSYDAIVTCRVDGAGWNYSIGLLWQGWAQGQLGPLVFLCATAGVWLALAGRQTIANRAV